MKEIAIHVKMLLELMKASLHSITPDTTFFENASAEDWHECAQLSAKQGVLIIAWDGMTKLPPNLQPTRSLRISWQLAVENYEKNYKKYCQVAGELTDFYQQHGIETIVLKGVGLSTYHPTPSHREGGDLDIYTRSANPNVMSDKEANLLADKLMEEQGIEIDNSHTKKHSNFTFKNIPIENHRTFLDLDRCTLAPTVERILSEKVAPHQVTLETGNQILIPSDEFNVLFVAFHTAQHYGSGITLHHLYDWACLINRFGLMLPHTLSERHFLNGIYALTNLCNQYLGTSVSVPENKKMANEILNEMINPILKRKIPPHRWESIKFRIHRFLYMIRIENSILYTPQWKNPMLWKKIKKLLEFNLLPKQAEKGKNKEVIDKL